MFFLLEARYFYVLDGWDWDDVGWKLQPKPIEI